jgi:hypothetical protein
MKLQLFTLINLFGYEIKAYSTLEDAWNNSNSNDEFGSGSWLKNDNYWIVMSENHPLFIKILSANIGWHI